MFAAQVRPGKGGLPLAVMPEPQLIVALYGLVPADAWLAAALSSATGSHDQLPQTVFPDWLRELGQTGNGAVSRSHCQATQASCGQNSSAHPGVCSAGIAAPSIQPFRNRRPYWEIIEGAQVLDDMPATQPMNTPGFSQSRTRNTV